MVEADRDWLLARLRAAVRDEALPLFRHLGAGDVAAKAAPDDLVSVADEAVEARLGQEIAERFPDALIIGEEAATRTPELMDRIGAAELAVILDPVDGTWNFVNGLPLWGAILAVCRFGKPVFGAIYDPLGDYTLGAVAGAGLFARHGERDAPVRRAQGRGALAGYVPVMKLPEPARIAVATGLTALGHLSCLRASAHEYPMLATGAVDYVLSGELKPWDHAAGALMNVEAGGVARLLDGRDYDAAIHSGWLLSAVSEDVWQQVAARLGPILSAP